MSPGATTTSSHLAGSTCSVPSARRSSLVERAPGSPPRTPHARGAQPPAGVEACAAPRPRQPAVVVDRDLAGLEVDVALLDAVAAAVQARAAGVRDRRVPVDPQ